MTGALAVLTLLTGALLLWCCAPSSPMRRSTVSADGSSAAASGTAERLVIPPAARRARPSALQVAGLIERLAVVIASGAAPRQSWQLVAAAEPPGPLADLARAVGYGADPRRAASGALGRSPEVHALGAALEVCERSGAPLAALLRSLASAQRDLHDASLARRSAFSGPRSTARILLALPAAGIGLGMLLGADPLATLTATGPGRALLASGLALTLVGWAWMRHLLRAAASSSSGGIDPSVLLELIAGALRAGLPLAGAAGIVARAAGSSGPTGPADAAATSLGRFAQALAGGVPSRLAAAHLDPSVQVLGTSALLAESSGADLAQVLRSAAADSRRGRARDAEAAAARLGVHLVLPTGLTLLPAFVLLGIIPTVASLLGGSFTGLGPG